MEFTASWWKGNPGTQSQEALAFRRGFTERDKNVQLTPFLLLTAKHLRVQL